MIKAIIFDFGGVISNITFDAETKSNALMLGIDVEKYRTCLRKYFLDAHCGKINTEKLVKNLSSDLGIDKDKLKEAWMESHNKLFILKNDVLKLVKNLKKSGYIVAMLSNITEFHSLHIRKRGIYDNFNPVVLSYDVGLIKPDKKIYRLVLKQLNLKPQECIFIDDKEENLQPAKELGMKTILFRDAEKLKEDLMLLKIKL